MSNDKCYITIDCPPGSTRPDNILLSVLNNTKLNSDNFTITSKSFGEWVFQLNEECNPNDYMEILPLVKQRLTTYYKEGKVRYAEWYEP